MNDADFEALALKATIAPQQARWPASEYTHWQALHKAANEARARVSRFYRLADEIDRNKSLSSDAKYQQRRDAAAEAIADFDSSRALMRAREAVERAGAHPSPEAAKDRVAALRAMKEAEYGWQRAIDKIAERACRTKNSTSARC
jgi:hypothetical protein